MVRSDGHHRLLGRTHQPGEPAGAAKMGLRCSRSSYRKRALRERGKLGVRSE